MNIVIVAMLIIVSQVTVQSNGRTFKRILSPSVCSIGQALCRGNWQSIANAVMKCEHVRSALLGKVLGLVSQECKHLCEVKDFSSVLRKSTKNDLKEFSWEKVASEFRKEAPIFFKFLLSVAAPKRSRNKVKGVEITARYPSICTAGSILLRERNCMMSAVQQLVGVILFHGDVHKQVRVFFYMQYTSL